MFYFQAFSYYYNGFVFWIFFCIIYFIFIITVGVSTYNIGIVRYDFKILWKVTVLLGKELKKSMICSDGKEGCRPPVFRARYNN